MKLKPVVSLICALALMLALCPAPSYAADEVFVATNNMILPLTDAMPIRSGSTWFIDYRCFTDGDLKVNSSYNSDSNTLVLYTWDTTLVFNLSNYTAYNTTDNIIHSQVSVASNGTFYVPAQFTAQQLGIAYSYIESPSCIRLRTTSTLSDSVFAYIVKNKMSELIAQYNASKAPSDSDVQDTSPQSPSSGSGSDAPNSSASNSGEEDVTVQKRVFLTFDVTSGKNNDKILDALSRYKMEATFFLSGDILAENDDSIRRMVIMGHQVGTLGFSGESGAFSKTDTMLDELRRANSLLYEVAHVKTRLVRVPGGSGSGLSRECADALIAAGYRYWDWTLDANGGRTSPGSARIGNTVINTLKQRTYAVIKLSDSDQTVSALPRILDYLSDNNCIVSTLSVLDSPANQRGDTR